MTVKELIEKLNDFNPEAIIYLYDNEYGSYPEVETVEEEEETLDGPTYPENTAVNKTIIVLR